MSIDFDVNFPEPEDRALIPDWERLRTMHAELMDLLESGKMFRGIGSDADNVPCPTDFPVLLDIDRATNMMYLDENDCHFAEKIQTPLEKSVYESYVSKGYDRKYSMFTYSSSCSLNMQRKMWSVLELHDVEEELQKRAGEAALQFEGLVDGPTLYFFRGMLDAAWYGGLDKHPFAKRLMEAYQTGGMPVGWVGPKVEDGGDPKECVQLLHFGHAEKDKVNSDALATSRRKRSRFLAWPFRKKPEVKNVQSVWQAHHIVPRSVYMRHVLFQRPEFKNFALNSSANGVALIWQPMKGVDISARPATRNGSHPGYDVAVTEFLDRIESRLAQTEDVDEAKQLLADGINAIRNAAQENRAKLNNADNRLYGVVEQTYIEIADEWRPILESVLP